MSNVQYSSVAEKPSVAVAESASYFNRLTPPISNGSSKSTYTASVSTSTSTSKSTTGTTSTSTTSSNLGPGPRRFRGDVPAFNPSSSSTHFYSEQIHHYTPQTSGSPLYPNQHPSYYPQQPQFIPYGGVPYYPVTLNYPDYGMYQQYQYYAMPGQPFQSPFMVMNGVSNGTTSQVSNRKKVFKTLNNSNHVYHYSNQSNTNNNYSHHNTNYHQSTTMTSSNNQPGGGDVSYKSSSAHTQPFSNVVRTGESASSPNLLSMVPNADHADTLATTTDAKVTMHNEISSVEPELFQKNSPNLDNSLKAETDHIQNGFSSSHISQLPEKIASSDEEKLNNTCHENLPVLFNIDLKEFEEYKALISKLSQKLLELKLTRVKELIDADLSKAYHFDETCTSFVVDHDIKSGMQIKLGADIPKSSVNIIGRTTNDASVKKPNLNWASLLQSTVKMSKKAVPEPLSNAGTLQKTLTSASFILPTSSDRYQSLGLLIMSILYDPDFDLYSQESYRFKPRGLTNTGNICYMNAVLQCLIFCNPFNKILRLLEERAIGSLGKISLTPVLDATIEFMHDFSTVSFSGKPNATLSNSDGIIVGRPLSPEKLFSSLIKSSKFQHLKWGQQEDAEEFLVYFLDGLHEDFVKAEAAVTNEQMNQLASFYCSKLDRNRADALGVKMKLAARRVNKTGKYFGEEKDDDGWSEVGGGRKVSSKRVSEVEPSPITKIFGGCFRSVLNIPKSKESYSITIDPFRSISLDISSDDVETIEDALRKMNEVEKLPYTNEDGMEVVASKQTYIEDLPEILTLQLKRFSFQHKGDQNRDDADVNAPGPYSAGRIEKILKNINFGLDLTVSLESLSPAARNVQHRNYLLSGVIYHHGRHAEGGHYTCDVLRGDGKWLRIDDTAVELIDAESVIEKPEAKDKSAYIFIYQRNGA